MYSANILPLLLRWLVQRRRRHRLLRDSARTKGTEAKPRGTYQELLELGGQVVGQCRDVEVPNDEDEDHGGRSGMDGGRIEVEVELRATRLCHRVPEFGALGGNGSRWRLGPSSSTKGSADATRKRDDAMHEYEFVMLSSIDLGALREDICAVLCDEDLVLKLGRAGSGLKSANGQPLASLPPSIPSSRHPKECPGCGYPAQVLVQW